VITIKTITTIKTNPINDNIEDKSVNKADIEYGDEADEAVIVDVGADDTDRVQTIKR
jgi:hypothetical protein